MRSPLTVGPIASTSAVSPSPTVFIIMMENHDWSSFKGSTDAPYINDTLLPAYAHAENYRTGGIYPSLPNYIALEAGDDFGLLGKSPLPTDFRIATTDHLTTYLANAGIPWKSYSEMLPGGGTVCPLTESGFYSLDHNAYVYFDDVTGNPPRSDNVYCRDHIRPYEELAADLRNDAVAGYTFIIPDDLDQGEKHTSSGSSLVAQSDTWLQREVPKILASPAYQRDGVLLILWDEAKTHGVDNPIGCILVSKLAKPGYSNTIPYSHGSTLRTVQEILGVTPLIRAAATATDLRDLFTTFPAATGASTTSTSTTSTTTSTTSTSTSTTSTSTSTTSTSTSTTSTSINATSTSTSTTSTSTSTTSTSTATSTSSTSTTTSTSLPQPSGGTVTYQAGVSGAIGSAAVDTNIRLSAPSTSYGSDVNLYVGVTNGPDKVYRTLMAFDLAGIPTGATVTACTLTVNVTQRTNPTPGHLRRLCGEHWRDGDGQSEAQATWSAWQTGATWTTPGAGSSAACTADGDATSQGELAYAAPPGTGLFTFPDLTALCQDALAQRGGWLRLRISQDVESTQSNLFRFDSSDAGTPATRPKLSVTWAAPATTSTSMSTTTSSTSSSSTTSTSSSTTSTSTTSSTSSTSTSTSSTTTSTSLPAPSTITYQAGVSGPSGSAAVDTNIRLSAPGASYGSDVNLYVGVTNGADKVFRTLIAFDLAGVPANAAITACTLTVNVTQRTNPTPGHLRRLCGEHWRDGDGQSEAQATWSAWQTGAAWTTPGAGSSVACTAGGDATTAGELAYVPPGGTGPFTFPDLSALCQDAIAQRGGWLRLRIAQDAENALSNLFRFDSSDAASPASRPRLDVTWTAP